MKPFNCTMCPATDPAQFYKHNKSLCRKCYINKQLQALEENPERKRANKERAAQWQNDNMLRYRWISAKNRAIKSGLAFTITYEQIEGLWADQGGLCYYTGAPMSLLKGEAGTTVSVDRRDNELGYTPENTVLCSKLVNVMKSNLPLPSFLDIIKLVYEKHVLPSAFPL